MRIVRRVLRILGYLVAAWILLSLLLVLPLRWLNPPGTLVMVNRWSQIEDFDLRWQWLAWQDIPPHAAMAVVASEDQRFPLHRGFDVDAMRDAWLERERRGQLRGASTISQQVARNLYLWTGRSWMRKGLEAWFTLLIEWFWPKERILEVYLNIAEWGPGGVFGLEAAAQYHFNKSAAQLNPWESALLAATLPSPARYTPGRPSAFMTERAQWNLQQQRMLGGTTWLAPLYQ
ncbi:MAG: monofunctional biosynthetic peptidoglycan transglycosylase [Natronospirillum sp.]|uniref:monofunctional biosynthetic peptidoglycan transglycosylase n=1 Tax=Natronospirillum sp. TaxID=2812955 RepID=UPI0025E8FB27|nr:monofunctional biosynthetic peptidoglycan transglycosylase [Natronospirillum sp.]MCH8550952.1 monofunctional biosynthetic peptidoglycan transglycosylase [Natronospirillum sp.]